MTVEGDDAMGNEAEQSAPNAQELLRHALVNDDDPRFPWWLPLPGIILALLWAGWQAASASAVPDIEAGPGMRVFLQTLVWPGAGIFLLTCVATWAGWQLEID